MLKVGKKAPQFKLPDKDGNMVSLSDFAGKKVVLYFYPRDNSPGCSIQAAAYARHYAAFTEKNAVVIGISKDPAESHQKFAERYNLPFLLLSDTELRTIKAYRVWQEKEVYGRKVMGVARITYLINEKGVIEKALRKLRPGEDAEQLLASLG